MKYFINFISLFQFLALNSFQVSGTLEAFYYQQDTKGRVLPNSSSVTLSSVFKCAQNCLSEINCKSFSYKNSTQECFWSEFSSYSVSSLALDFNYTVIYDTEPDGAACEPGWKVNTVKQTCLKFFFEPKTAIEARAVCASVGANLLMLDTQEVYEWYQTLVAEEPSWGGVIWIGARKEHGEWSWDNGDSLGNENWEISRPQNLGSCVVMHTYFKWIDLPCSSYTNFVCER